MNRRTFENAEEEKEMIFELRNKNMSYNNIAIRLHISPKRIRKILLDNNYKVSVYNEDYNYVFDRCGLTFDDVYINSDTPSKCICKKCGATHYVTYHNLVSHLHKDKHYQYKCYDCCRELSYQKKEYDKAYKKLIKALKKIAKQKEKTNNKKEYERYCKQCGIFFSTTNSNKKFCSEICCNRFHDKKKDYVRTNRIKNNGHIDYTITLEKLYKRDKGICYLCNGKCDYEDYTYKGNIFVAGNYYPSIDHIKPLAKGGMHDWNNVKLAHRICNSIKSDND